MATNKNNEGTTTTTSNSNSSTTTSGDQRNRMVSFDSNKPQTQPQPQPQPQPPNNKSTSISGDDSTPDMAPISNTSSIESLMGLFPPAEAVPATVSDTAATTAAATVSAAAADTSATVAATAEAIFGSDSNANPGYPSTPAPAAGTPALAQQPQQQQQQQAQRPQPQTSPQSTQPQQAAAPGPLQRPHLIQSQHPSSQSTTTIPSARIASKGGIPHMTLLTRMRPSAAAAPSKATRISSTKTKSTALAQTNTTTAAVTGAVPTQVMSNNPMVVALPSNPPSLPAPAATITSAAASTGQHHHQYTNNNSIPEFLFQLTKMLTDNNKEVIEWSNGKIEVHNPRKLESQVLLNYFRHSRFASFQRQLNYFGFRKLAGKGKMAPCSYINESATGNDIGSLLLIKRKTSTAPSRDRSGKKRDANGKVSTSSSSTTLAAPPAATRRNSSKAVRAANSIPTVNPVLANILYRSKTSAAAALTKSAAAAVGVTADPIGSAAIAQQPQGTAPLVQQQPNPTFSGGAADSHQKTLARSAVGRGVRHNCSAMITSRVSNATTTDHNASSVQPVATAASPAEASAAAFHAGAMAAKIISSAAMSTASVNANSGNNDSFAGGATAALQSIGSTTATEDCLNELANNYKNSLNELESSVVGSTSVSAPSDMFLLDETEPTPLVEMKNASNVQSPPGNSEPFTGFLSRDSSLIDLAMIPPVESDQLLDVGPNKMGGDIAAGLDDSTFNFVDFPQGQGGMGMDPGEGNRSSSSNNQTHT